jgi:hypothetical protein
MRTLILLGILTACVVVAIVECSDRSDRRKVAAHAGGGLLVGFLLWRLIVHAGVFDNW